PVATPQGILGMADGENGGLLISSTGAVTGLADGKSYVANSLPTALRRFEIKYILRDRHGGLWLAGPVGGIVHIHNGRTDIFSRSDGLTGDHVLALFEDREGSIWIATDKGLDRFRELPVVTYSTKQGLAHPSGAVVGTRDGSIWFGTSAGLTR